MANIRVQQRQIYPWSLSTVYFLIKMWDASHTVVTTVLKPRYSSSPMALDLSNQCGLNLHKGIETCMQHVRAL